MYNYPHLDDVFISSRLQECLGEIENHRITTIIAPMGFGKSTAISWWAKYRQEQNENAIVVRQIIINDSLSDFWNGFCRGLKGLPLLAEQVKELGYSQDPRTLAILAELIEDGIASLGGAPIYYILDDAHFLPQQTLAPILYFLFQSLPDNVHIILLSRNQIFAAQERMQFGNLLAEITVEDLRLKEAEISLYAKNCGIKASAAELNSLVTLSEGWISMVYLNFKSFAQNGEWLLNSTDIFTLIEEVLLEPLAKRQQEFLILMGMTDEFTKEQAAYLWQDEDAAELLDDLTKNNAFIKRSENGIYRYHHMLRQCTRQKFLQKPLSYQTDNYIHLGEWHLNKEEYIPAYYIFAQIKAWDNLLITMARDKLKSLNSEHSQDFSRWLQECPEDFILKHPEAITPCMVKSFSFHNIPELIRLKGLLLKSLAQDTLLTEKERHDLLGDAEVAESFLKYNNISAMSEHHRRACTLLSRTSLSVDPKGAWTFSAPSIFMMYHRAVGNADQEKMEMHECMPYYYQVSDGHGNGAEHSFAADLCYERGQFVEADIANRMARAAAERKNQYSIMINADFLSMRLALVNGDYATVKKIGLSCREWLLKERQYTLLNTFDMCQGYLYALLGNVEAAPQWFREGKLSEALVMFPAMPMLNTFYNQVLLAKREWTALLARRTECEKVYGVYNNVMCQIWLHIQLAVALSKLNKLEAATGELQIALDMAIPDKIIMPLVENIDYIGEILESLQGQGVYPAQIGDILTVAEKFHVAKQKVLMEYGIDSEEYGLSARELEIARLAALRKTNAEIAATLHLAEGTVRNQLSRIFNKLEISGNSKNKRLALEEFLHKSK